MKIIDHAKLLLRSRNRYVNHITPELTHQEQAICDAVQAALDNLQQKVSWLTEKARAGDDA